MKGDNTYLERQSEPNVGELRFEKYCSQNSIPWQRLGFDEKNNNIPNFFNLSIYLRNLPDYLVVIDGQTNVVNVKGTGNFKSSELLKLPSFQSMYATNECPLLYAFCFAGNLPVLHTIGEIKQLYEASSDKHWDDGVVYRTLRL
jgi:hypothetical protein